VSAANEGFDRGPDRDLRRRLGRGLDLVLRPRQGDRVRLPADARVREGAGFKPETLEEHWPAGPRELVKLALDAAKATPAARCDVPVVEASLLAGDKGCAVVLANFTYRPIEALTVDVTLPRPVTRATSSEGVEVTMEPTPDGVRLRLPLAWTDIVLLH